MAGAIKFRPLCNGKLRMFNAKLGYAVGVASRDRPEPCVAQQCATLYIYLESLIVVFSSGVLSLTVIPTKVSLTSPRGGPVIGLPCLSKKSKMKERRCLCQWLLTSFPPLILPGGLYFAVRVHPLLFLPYNLRRDPLTHIAPIKSK